MNKILNVDGITCEHCVDTIKEGVENPRWSIQR